MENEEIAAQQFEKPRSSHHASSQFESPVKVEVKAKCREARLGH